MNPPWRLHPISRALAGLLAVGIVSGILIGVVMGVLALAASHWQVAAVSIAPVTGLPLARLFWVAARTGEEPPYLDVADQRTLKLTKHPY